jgi:alpha-glucosidase
VQEEDPNSPLNFARRMIAWRKTMPQLTRGDIVFYDAPEPVLALRRDLEGERSVIALFNLGAAPVNFALPAVKGAQKLEQPGLPGEVSGEEVQLPGYGAWFGYAV